MSRWIAVAGYVGAVVVVVVLGLLDLIPGSLVAAATASAIAVLAGVTGIGRRSRGHMR